jgi:hypothetical protein
MCFTEQTDFYIGNSIYLTDKYHLNWTNTRFKTPQ